MIEIIKLEGIEEIIWRVDSKISEVRFVSSSGKDNLKFEYDAMGNRVAKYVMDGQTSFAKHVTYYVRDASGSVMAVYEHDLETPESYHLSERHIYGSSRVGMITEKVEFEYVYGNLPTEELVPTLAIEETGNFELEYSVGKKQYELSNHLGNVLAVISDWKLPVISGASVVSYTTVVVSSQDYSPFGVTLSGRSWSAGYRYGFNGKEKDPEGMGGGGNTYDYGFRIYNQSLAKFLSTDPLVKSYPTYSPYHFAANSPIKFIDLDGMEMYVTGTAADRFINLLAARTGLTLTKDANGLLTYATTKVTDGKGGEKEVPQINVESSSFVSEKLRNELIKIVDKEGRRPVTVIAKTQKEIKAELGKDNVLIDSFHDPNAKEYNWVDVDDLDFLGADGGDLEVVQAALIGHVIRERGALNPSGKFVDTHTGAMLFERDIIGEKFPGKDLKIRGDADDLYASGGLLDPVYTGMSLDSHGLPDYATGLNLDYGTAQFVTISPIITDESNKPIAIETSEIVGALGGAKK